MRYEYVFYSRLGEQNGQQTMKPPLIQYWHEESVPADVEQLLVQAAEHNQGMHHLVFNERTAAELISRQLGDRETAAFEACAVPALQADFFRCCAVYSLGGVYLDADSWCFGSLMPLLEPAGTLFCKERPGYPGLMANDVFGFRSPRHPVLGLIIEIAVAGIESRFTGHLAFMAGQPIFTLLTECLKCGSVDRHLEELRQRVEGFGRTEQARRRIYKQLGVIREIIGDYCRLAAAFEGVRIASIREVKPDLVVGARHLAYKQTRNHYPNWPGGVFR